MEHQTLHPRQVVTDGHQNIEDEHLIMFGEFADEYDMWLTTISNIAHLDCFYALASNEYN